MGAFLITAVAAGQLAVRLKQHRAAAEARRDETEKLCRLANAMLSNSRDFSLAELADRIVGIFGAQGVALYAGV